MDVAVSAFGSAYKHTASQALGHSVKLHGKASVGSLEVKFETVVPPRDGAAGGASVEVEVPAPRAADVFASRMRDILNASATNVGISIGVRTGLFDAMAAAEHPVSVAELAMSTRLEDRYIEEWLAVMVCGGIASATHAAHGAADDSPTGGAGGAGAGAPVAGGDGSTVARFSLAPGAAGCLATGAASGKTPVLAQRSLQVQALVTEGYDHMHECFSQGGGVPAIMFPASLKAAAALRADTPVAKLVAQVPGLREALSVQGARILLVDDRTASTACAFGAAFPSAAVVAWCQTPEDLEAGKAAAVKASVSNVVFEAASADWGCDEESRGVFTYALVLLGLGPSNDPIYALENLRVALRPGGRLSVLQLAAAATATESAALQPLAAVEYTASLLHTLPLSRSGDAAGVGLMWNTADALATMQDGAGFQVAHQVTTWDPTLVHFVCTKPQSADAERTDGDGDATMQ